MEPVTNVTLPVQLAKVQASPIVLPAQEPEASSRAQQVLEYATALSVSLSKTHAKLTVLSEAALQ